ncbi:helix-turn-helix domain-containing protein [Ekhidna sp.]|uniref:AraC family transcriptional regulator n=1 Tax=Ekhidna sp. TaxID=2608089 RepID=UPI0032EC8AB3
MQFNEYVPCEKYSSLVKCFWSINGEAQNKLERIVPGGCAEILFNLGDPLTIEKGSDVFEFKNVIIGGQITGHVNIPLKGNIDIFAIRFYPSTAHQVLRSDMDDLNDSFYGYSEVVSNKQIPSLDHMLVAGNDKNRIQALNTFLERCLSTYDSSRQVRVNQCIDALNKQTDHFSKYDLAAELKVTSRRVEQIFSELIGLRPKLFWRIKRLQKIVNEMRLGMHHNLTQLAYHFDYFDQAHFNRDFKMLTGIPPKEYLNEQPFLSSKFTDPEGLSQAL